MFFCAEIKKKISEPSWSKLIVIKISVLKYGKYIDIFCWKSVSSFCIAKATHIFAAKIINVFENTLATTVNEFVINKLVKVAMLWTTGPCTFRLEKKFFVWSYEWHSTMLLSDPSKNIKSWFVIIIHNACQIFVLWHPPVLSSDPSKSSVDQRNCYLRRSIWW